MPETSEIPAAEDRILALEVAFLAETLARSGTSNEEGTRVFARNKAKFWTDIADILDTGENDQLKAGLQRLARLAEAMVGIEPTKAP